MESTRTGMHVADAAWPLVEERLDAGDAALLPIGAAAKEHGYHLPLATDCRQAEWMTDRLLESEALLAWPVLAYGYYPVFVDYPGSISLERETFMAVVAEILGGIAHAGATRIVLLNTGISTIEPIESLLATDPVAARCLLVNVYSGARYRDCAKRLQEQGWGGHGDELETSIMLAIAPERVDMNRAEGNTRPIRRGLFVRDDPASPNYTASGVNGDPRAATAAKGEALLDALLTDVREQIRAFLRDD